MEDKEQKNADDLWKEFLDIINKQLEVNTELKDIVEDFTKASSPKMAPDLTGERIKRIQDLFIEMESSLGEERAIYHSLFGIEE
jgi:Tfp pilus assembly protein PilO